MMVNIFKVVKQVAEWKFRGQGSEVDQSTHGRMESRRV
jgi:hypothetical protein